MSRPRSGTGRMAHSAQKCIVGEALGRTGGYVNHVVALRCYDALRQIGIITTGIHSHLVPSACKRSGQLR